MKSLFKNLINNIFIYFCYCNQNFEIWLKYEDFLMYINAHNMFKSCQRYLIIIDNWICFKKLYIQGDAVLCNSSLNNLNIHMFDSYLNWVRPVKNPNTTTNITIDLTLLQILSVVIKFKTISSHIFALIIQVKDDSGQTITISGWLNLVRILND